MRHPFLLVAICGLAGAPASAQKPAAPCCGIIIIDQATGIVTAKVTATGSTFLFKAPDPRTLASLRVGQGVYANFAGKQVSLDGRSACCAITGGPTLAAAPPPAPPPAPRGTSIPPVVSGTAATGVSPVSGINTVAVPPALLNSLPAVTFGTPVPRKIVRSRPTSRFESALVTTQVAGRSVTTRVLYLRGLKAVEQAPDLPDGAKRVLEMLVRRTPRNQSDHYIVNIEMARDWIAKHPVPESVKPTEPKEKKCGNWYDSWDCATEAVSDEWERAYDHAVDEWKDAEKTLADAWQTATACFAERTISSGDIPVKFSITPSMTVNLSQSGSQGSAQGTVSGSATLGVPLESDFTAKLDLFYIPCVPFAVRPKTLAGDGVLTVGEELRASVTATGSFQKTFTIPPTGGPVIPIQVIPIVIGGVPVAEMDVSAYIEGNIEVRAKGKAEGQFQIRNANPTQFSFSCSGQGCKTSGQARPSTTTMNESAQIQGTVSVKPAIYTAIQLDFNYQALSARAGLQPYLLGTASGCAAAAGSQTVGGRSTGAENHLLSGDLDWGVELRAEALVLGKVVSDPYVTRLMADKHIWFRDVAPGGSNALVAVAESTGQAMAGKPASYKVRMPSCYPYTDDVQYTVTWTGNAAPLPRPGCQWSAGRGSCKFDPAKELLLTLTWPAAGSYALSVTLSGDEHNRNFSPAPPPLQLGVAVSP